MSFKDLKLNPQLLKALEAKGYEQPSPIQLKAIPSILSGQDIFGIAQTGTGKTAAYLLPILMKLKYAEGNDPRSLIMVPTRELAIQVASELESFCIHLDLRFSAFYGGTGIKPQMDIAEKGLDIIVATPGRLIDIHKKGVLNLKKLKTIVLDEADRMMDMGFMPQINKILEFGPMKKQCLLFSATLSEKVEKLAEDFVEFPVKIEIAPSATTAETIEQKYYSVPNLRTKIELLGLLLKKYQNQKVIIFVKTKKSADDVYKFILRKVREDVGVIHANKGQNTRINTINSFESGEKRILVATDVSARGIDISDVAVVINFNVPLMYEDYVHRIGRTGRAQKSGEAITFADASEEFHLSEILELINKSIPELDLPAGLEVFETSKEEKIEIEREIDRYKRRKDPEFKGAFHESSKKKSHNRKGH